MSKQKASSKIMLSKLPIPRQFKNILLSCASTIFKIDQSLTSIFELDSGTTKIEFKLARNFLTRNSGKPDFFGIFFNWLLLKYFPRKLCFGKSEFFKMDFLGINFRASKYLWFLILTFRFKRKCIYQCNNICIIGSYRSEGMSY